MLQNGLRTFEKWLEYFQMAEMHWHFFLGGGGEEKKSREWMRFGVPLSFMFITLLLEAVYFRFAFVSRSGTYFFSLNKALGERRATPSHNQPFHSTANLRQPEGYQHCEASAPTSARAGAAVWEFLTAGFVLGSVFLQARTIWGWCLFCPWQDMGNCQC